MARGRQKGEDDVQQRPAWIIPALAIIGIAVCSTVFLYYYFGPSANELLGRDPEASAAKRQVDAVVAGVAFLVPENYTRYPAQRSGGVQPELSMHALLPDFQPYALERDAQFADNSATSPVIFFSLHETSDTLPAERRLKEIYARYLASPTPAKDSTGLERFTFKPESAYKDQDLMVGMGIDGRLVLLTCQRETSLVESPNCSRTLLLKPNLAVVYRYKRAYLESWQKVDEGVVGLVKSFEAAGSDSGLNGSIPE